MKKQLILLIVFLILFGGCTQMNINVEKTKFVGTWRDSKLTGYAITLSSDGKFNNSWNLNGTWDLIDDKLVLDYTEIDTYTYTYEFYNDNKTLNLTVISINDTPVNASYIYLKEGG